MAVTGLAAVAHLAAHTLYAVVASVAVGKTVGHEHVEHVGISESHTTVAAHLTRLKLIFHFHCEFANGEIEFHDSRLCTCSVEVNEQIVGTVEPHNGVDFHSRIIGFHLGIANVGAIYHELKRWVFHAHKPIGWLNAFNIKIKCHGDCPSTQCRESCNCY